ncbi:ABC transporter permease [Natrialba swarupiae]|uniref:ABC transporter permease n=1 Tax=Natrialba swarupiae TaxID=2448032 RepID=A0A5D5AIB9_9EURY|nr:ABC transporter permease [Natrialba swarupiae]TYT60673.1 ABC transporter permease [Natrialba swarupiae]
MSTNQSTITTATESARNSVATAYSKSRSILEGERLAQFGVIVLAVFIFAGLFAPFIVPHDPGKINHGEDGDVLRLAEPTAEHPFGTTHLGRDVMSQVMMGAQVSLIVGLTAAAIATVVGTSVALVAGYYGGKIDNILMRLVDIAYGLPFLPFVIALVFIFGSSLYNIILVISLLMWRSSARVIRSEVLTQKERPYVQSARAAGASDFRIMFRHILPNVLPLVVLYLTFGVAWAVIYEASIAFLGFGDPDMYSWGTILYEAYINGAIRYAWWWVIPPGVSIMLFVMSVFFIGRSLEKVTNPDLRHN